VARLEKAGHVIGLQTHALNASTIGEIDAAFASLAHDRPDALFVSADGFLLARRMQIATLAARDRIPAAYPNRNFVADGGLMSYGTDLADGMRQVGVYAGKILNGTKPADLPVVQPSRDQPQDSQSPRPHHPGNAVGDGRRDYRVAPLATHNIRGSVVRPNACNSLPGPMSLQGADQCTAANGPLVRSPNRRQAST